MKKSSKKSLKRKSDNPSTAANRYTGPIRIPESQTQNQVVPVQMYQEVAVTTNGSGVAAPVVVLSLASFDEYTNFSAVYDEWRLIGAEVEYVPLSTVPTASLTAGTTSSGNMVLCVDRDSSGNLTSQASGTAQAGITFNPFTRSGKIIYRIESSDESIFLSTTSGVQAWFKLYAASLANTQTYGTLFVKGLWQFRGRQ